MAMVWEPGDFYWKHSGEYKISRGRMRGRWLYSAWFRRDLLGVFQDVAAAERACELHQMGIYPADKILPRYRSPRVAGI